MRKSRFTESQIVTILKQGEAGVPICAIPLGSYDRLVLERNSNTANVNLAVWPWLTNEEIHLPLAVARRRNVVPPLDHARLDVLSEGASCRDKILKNCRAHRLRPPGQLQTQNWGSSQPLLHMGKSKQVASC